MDRQASDMSHSEADHVRSHVKVYVGVFLALCIFTLTTVAIAGVHLGVVLGIIAGLLVAATKGSLVGLFFMHLNHERKAIYWTLGLTGVLFLPLILLPVLALQGSSRSEKHIYAVEPPPQVVAEGEHAGSGAGGEHETAPPAGTKTTQPEPEPEPTKPLGPTGEAPTATILGRVVLEGEPPTMPSLLALMQQRDATCAAAHAEPPLAEQVVVGDGGGLANVFVYVSDGMKERFPPPKDPVIFNQKGCIYSPHVIGVQVGQKLLVENDDPLVHNVNMQSQKNGNVNAGQKANDPPVEVTFRRGEIPVRVKCDVHPWMNAWIGVVEHPYFAVSDADGTFHFSEKIRPGTYKVTAWHEKYGPKHQIVTIDDNGSAEVTFSFSQ